MEAPGHVQAGAKLCAFQLDIPSRLSYAARPHVQQPQLLPSHCSCVVCFMVLYALRDAPPRRPLFMVGV